MTIQERKKRDFKIAQYLATPIGKTKTSKLIYPSYEEASKKFGLHSTHIFKIKKELIGLDINGERKMPELEGEFARLNQI
ncbi:MAG: hypothetical protein AABY22_12785 [Nanoarchaeota archaeon]